MVIKSEVQGGIDALKEELLWGLGELNDTVNLHFDPSIERMIKEMDHGWHYLILQLHQLKLSEDWVHKLEVRISESILEVDGNRILIIL